MDRSLGETGRSLAVVIAVATFLAAGCGSGQGLASPTASSPSVAPSSSASPTPSPSPTLEAATASAFRALPIGDLQAGATYAVPFDGSQMLLTVPADGWFTIDDWFLGKDTLGDADPGADGFYDLALLPYPVANVYGDPCHWKGSALTPPVGPTVDDLAAALVEQAGAAAIAPTDVTLGGHAGKKVELTIPDDVDTSTCDEGDYGRWAPAEDPSWYGPFTYGKGQHDSVYIIDVEGTRWVIDATHLPGTTEADLAELDQLVASIRFED